MSEPTNHGVRLPQLYPDDLTDEQRLMWAELSAGGRGAKAVRPEGFLTGPFDVLLRSPDVGRAVARLGDLLRFGSDLSQAHRELVICTVAGRWQARYAWLRHDEYARAAGIPQRAIEAVAAGDEPELDGVDKLVWRYADGLVREGRVADELYSEALAALGERALVELTALAGYYCLCSFVLNAFDVPLPEGASVPWDRHA
ncbi:carboxymuconolactone decarboxylase family protein [Amycolatopsis sp. NPDC001319]|uniref:carboxymuconolactone decarboxylase family protein n=1 Tax=unclassified Amycolatopsis TaxID=2618356 RepID=UPI0036A607B8